MGLSFDDKAFERARRLAGLKGYVTNIPAHLSHGRQIIAHYHELWHVDQSFRTSKHDLKARPILSATPKTPSTPSLTIVTAAQALARHLYQATGITAPKLVKKLIDLQEINITLPNGQQHTAYPQIDPQTQELLTLLGH